MSQVVPVGQLTFRKAFSFFSFLFLFFFSFPFLFQEGKEVTRRVLQYIFGRVRRGKVRSNSIWSTGGQTAVDLTLNQCMSMSMLSRSQQRRCVAGECMAGCPKYPCKVSGYGMINNYANAVMPRNDPQILYLLKSYIMPCSTSDPGQNMQTWWRCLTSDRMQYGTEIAAGRMDGN